jgi:hypothetical protein
MSTAFDIIRQATGLGLKLRACGDQVAVYGDQCPPEFATMLRAHKTELLDWLSRQPLRRHGAIPPADLPLNGVMPKPTPIYREQVINFVLQQGDGRPCRLYKWIVQRESAYYDGPGRHWDCALHAYAAARDAGCWQAGLDEVDLWRLLEVST